MDSVHFFKLTITTSVLIFLFCFFSPRAQELKRHLSQVEQLDQALQKFSHWSETLLSTLHSASQVNITDLQPAASQVKVQTVANRIFSMTIYSTVIRL